MNKKTFFPRLTAFVLSLILSAFCAEMPLCAQEVNQEVTDVHIIFKTHLDIGYTDLSANVTETYVRKFIPKAIEIARQLRSEGGKERYVWTTGAWLIDKYLETADEEAVKKLEEAIAQGDICWNAMPFTPESESCNEALFRGIMKLNTFLDNRYGRKTVAAKVTDVPGHTRSIVPILHDSGIKMLHVGVNGPSTVPEVPPFFKWRDEASGKEIIMVYDSQYGGEKLLPDGKTLLVISFTGDNEGPHSINKIREIFADLQRRYPNARIQASSLDAIVPVLERCSHDLPTITSEIADTWIYGYASAPVRMKRFRELSRLYATWVKESQIDPSSREGLDFALQLGLVSEHTWGLRGSNVGHFEIYDYDLFQSSRDLPSFRFAEETWKEQDELITKAIRLLPDSLRLVAEKRMDEITSVSAKTFRESKSAMKKIDSLGRFTYGKWLVGGVSYQSYSKEDYLAFQKRYTRVYNPGFDKVDLEKVANCHALVDAVPYKGGKVGKSYVYDMAFPETEGIDKRLFPRKVQVEYTKVSGGLDITVSIIDKPANRKPEALWFSFDIGDILSIVAEKTGEEVNLLDVVPGGNRKMHFIDGYVLLVTDKGTIRITSYDAPDLTIGERDVLGFSKDYPSLKDGIHFCLFNNLWSTNFTLWWEGSVSYRFRVEIL